MYQGELFGVSVGPGDPELLTLKAIRAIQKADVVAVPNTGHSCQTAYSVARQYVQDKVLLECHVPMTKDRSVVEAAYVRTANDICALLEEGRNVAYLCLGDIGIYSSYIHIHDIVCSRGYRATIIPGVTSFSACAAKLGIALCEGQEMLLVAPATAPNIDDVLDAPGTKVLMKPGKDLNALRNRLCEHGLLDKAVMVANCGLPSEKVYANLEDAPNPAAYFSVIVVKGTKGS